MPILEAKKISDSQTEQVQIIMSGDINGYGRLFGGRLVEWIDIVAAVVARRHSGYNVITASMDNLYFKAPAYANETVVLVGRVVHTGHTSMEIRVDTYVENKQGKRNLINQAYVVMVALDISENPVPVPSLKLENNSQRTEWEAREKHYRMSKHKRWEDL